MAMERIGVKTKLKKLLSFYDGPKEFKYNILANELHISRRGLLYLMKGEKKASFHLAEFINELLRNKINNA